MVELLYQVQLWSTTGIGLLLVIMGLLGRTPSGFSLSLLAAVEVMLFLQLAIGLGIVIGGGRAVQSTWEYFGYLLVSVMVPVAGTIWALVERTRWSTLVLGAAALTISVMLVRMWQIWTGTIPG